jgi:hypothetical protein
VFVAVWTLPAATATTSSHRSTRHSSAALLPTARTVPSQRRPTEWRLPAASADTLATTLPLTGQDRCPTTSFADGVSRAPAPELSTAGRRLAGEQIPDPIAGSPWRQLGCSSSGVSETSGPLSGLQPPPVSRRGIADGRCRRYRGGCASARILAGTDHDLLGLAAGQTAASSDAGRRIGRHPPPRTAGRPCARPCWRTASSPGSRRHRTGPVPAAGRSLRRPTAAGHAAES